MSVRTAISTPTAIVLGSLIVAVGVFVSREAPRALPAPEQTPAPVTASRPEPPLPVTLDRAAVTRAATEALAYHRPMLRARCYLPAVAGQSPPPPVKFTLSLSFDPAGAQVIRGLNEHRGAGIPAVTQCVGDALPPLFVPPPGVATQVDVPLEFP